MSDDELDLMSIDDVERLLRRRFAPHGGFALVTSRTDPKDLNTALIEGHYYGGPALVLGLLAWAKNRVEFREQRKLLLEELAGDD